MQDEVAESPSHCQSEFPATKGLPSSFWASSSAIGSRPISLNICLDLHMMLLMVSIISTKMGIVGAWSADAYLADHPGRIG
jgi:hypothetical protein